MLRNQKDLDNSILPHYLIYYLNSHYSNSVLTGPASFSWAYKQGGYAHTGWVERRARSGDSIEQPSHRVGERPIQGCLQQNDRKSASCHDLPWVYWEWLLGLPNRTLLVVFSGSSVMLGVQGTFVRQSMVSMVQIHHIALYSPDSSSGK